MSDPERKNPFGAIHAFQRAFPDDARANLVIKLNNAQGANHTLVPILTKLRELCKADRRIRIIDEVLSYSDVLCLYASCDVFVSLHRSEGYGFGLLEAMALGKPVIATAWSGNMAFMSHANSCLVRYKLIPVNANLRVYSRVSLGAAATWADPDLDEAAAWMRKLVEDPGYRISLGHRAAMDTIDLQREAQKGKFVDEIRAVWQNYAFLPHRGRNEKIEALNEIRRTWQEQASTTSAPETAGQICASCLGATCFVAFSAIVAEATLPGRICHIGHVTADFLLHPTDVSGVPDQSVRSNAISIAIVMSTTTRYN